MFVRTTNRIGKIALADSKDNGITWSALEPIDLPNPNSGIDAVALTDGRIVLIYNHTAKGRTPLKLAVSPDGDRVEHVTDTGVRIRRVLVSGDYPAQDRNVHVT